jgi:hypothetical protein
VDGDQRLVPLGSWEPLDLALLRGKRNHRVPNLAAVCRYGSTTRAGAPRHSVQRRTFTTRRDIRRVAICPIRTGGGASDSVCGIYFLRAI